MDGAQQYRPLDTWIVMVVAGSDPVGAKIAVIATNVPGCHDRAWPGHPRLADAPRAKVVGGRPEPVLARAFGPTRGPAMTRGVALPTSRYFSANETRSGDQARASTFLSLCWPRRPRMAGLKLRPSSRLRDISLAISLIRELGRGSSFPRRRTGASASRGNWNFTATERDSP
jgi:hypothetical protein